MSSLPDARSYSAYQFEAIREAHDGSLDYSRPQFCSMPGMTVSMAKFMMFKESDIVNVDVMKVILSSMCVGLKVAQFEVVVVEVQSFDAKDEKVQVKSRFRCAEYANIMAKQTGRPQMILIAAQFKEKWTLAAYNASSNSSMCWGLDSFIDTKYFDIYCRALIDSICSPSDNLKNSCLSFEDLLADQGLIAIHKISQLLQVTPVDSTWVGCKKRCLWILYSLSLISNFDKLKSTAEARSLRVSTGQYYQPTVVGADDSELGKSKSDSKADKSGTESDKKSKSDGSSKSKQSNQPQETPKAGSRAASGKNKEKSSILNSSSNIRSNTKLPTIMSKRNRAVEPEYNETSGPKFWGFGNDFDSSSRSSGRSHNLYQQITVGNRQNPLMLNNPNHLQNHIIGSGVGNPMVYQQPQPQRRPPPRPVLPALPSRNRRRRPRTPSYTDESSEPRKREKKRPRLKYSSNDRSESPRDYPLANPGHKDRPERLPVDIQDFEARMDEINGKYKSWASNGDAVRFKIKQHMDNLEDKFEIVGMEYTKLQPNAKISTIGQNMESSTAVARLPSPVVSKPIEFKAEPRRTEEDEVMDEYKRQKLDYEMKKEIAQAKNKLIKQENHRRNIQARDRMSKKIELVNTLMEKVKIIPPAPNVPQIFSIGGGQQYPIDFNMKVQILNDQDKAGKKLAKKQEIERTLVVPLANLYVRLDAMRSDIKRLRQERDQLKDSLKDVDEANMDDDEIEELQLQQERYEKHITRVEDKKQEIERVKAMIPPLKSKLVNLMKTLAQKEYLSDPSSIFDIPQNLNLQQLKSQFQLDAEESFKAMLELQHIQERHKSAKDTLQQQKVKAQQMAALDRINEETSNSDSDSDDSLKSSGDS